MSRLIDRVRTLAEDARLENELEVWMVLDHLADAMVCGRAGSLAYAMAMEAPSLDETLLDRLAERVYSEGEVEPEDPHDPRYEAERRWNLRAGSLHVALTLADEGRRITARAWRGTFRECVLHAMHAEGRAVRFFTGDSDALALIVEELSSRTVAA